MERCTRLEQLECPAQGPAKFYPAGMRITPSVLHRPDTHKSRWDDELTAEKMKECVWLRPEAVAQIEFLEWTEADRLRHSKSAGLRDDKNPREVVKEA